MDTFFYHLIGSVWRVFSSCIFSFLKSDERIFAARLGHVRGSLIILVVSLLILLNILHFFYPPLKFSIPKPIIILWTINTHRSNHIGKHYDRRYWIASFNWKFHCFFEYDRKPFTFTLIMKLNGIYHLIGDSLLNAQNEQVFNLLYGLLQMLLDTK